ncbi:exported hypothetical protein [Nitrospira lenta]|uniref:Uncharacterized protein n=1 Tax=Nitrospira lenta TaxID=1436998 RepID=A0A330L534_9BACT|nr:exported hypothetical protein [Nitrospira lenta]
MSSAEKLTSSACAPSRSVVSYTSSAAARSTVRTGMTTGSSGRVRREERVCEDFRAIVQKSSRSGKDLSSRAGTNQIRLLRRLLSLHNPIEPERGV